MLDEEVEPSVLPLVPDPGVEPEPSVLPLVDEEPEPPVLPLVLDPDEELDEIGKLNHTVSRATTTDQEQITYV